MADDSFGERTEKATQKRRNEARKKGQVAKSREISSVAVLLVALSVLYLLSTYFLRQISSVMARSFQKIGTFAVDFDSTLALQAEIVWWLFQILAPLLLAISAVAILSNFVQVGGLFSTQAIQPQFKRINPIQGLSRLFSRQSLVELLKSVGKILIIGWVAYSTVRQELAGIRSLPDQDVAGILGFVGLVSARILFKTLLVMIGLAALDYFFQRWSHEKSLRMTKREVFEEYKQAEGDPLIKSRIRSIQREMARKRMMAEVPKADVVITNPAHLAVALLYEREEMAAPRVVAKGSGWIAEKIKEVARAHGVPILENKPLAQALYKTVELGQMIPSSMYQMVADLLAHVYRMKSGGSRRK
jgi:flagellar biosynthesis protein FlhB